MINFSFLAIGKTHESTESFESKKYIGLASSYVLAVNPTKKEAEAILGYELSNEPEYIKADSEVANIRLEFYVKTDPEQNNGVEVINRMSFFLYNEGQYNGDKTKMQVIDKYGNTSWGLVEDVKMNKILLQKNGKEAKIDRKYRPAYRGEGDLVAFLKTYLGVQDAFSYVNEAWQLKDNAADYEFGLEHIKDYFKGDVSELKEALKLQPKNKIKLLYGIRTTDSGQFQTIATRADLMLANNAGERAKTRLVNNLTQAKASGSFATTEFQVCPLKEYVLEATNLAKPQPSATPSEDVSGSSEMPWD